MSDDLSFDDAMPPEGAVIYHGRKPTATEAISGVAVYEDREPWKPLQPGKKGHRTLQALAALMTDNHGRMGRWTAYEISHRLCNDGHGARRELERLLRRGFVRKDGTKTNVGVVVNGRPHVDAFTMTAAGWFELRRLNQEEA